MKKVILSISIFSLILSCSTEGVKKAETKNENNVKLSSEANKDKKGSKKTAINSDDLEVSSTKEYDNGLMISWIEKGKGEPVKKGDVILIDYKVTLDDGSVVDGNHLWKKESFPFVVGYQMQTKGWDFALSKMKVGDYARIKIPSELARGEKGIRKEGEKGWFVPPNATNYLTIHILKKQKPTRVVDGTKVWLFEENKAVKEKFDGTNAIIFHSMISSESNPMYYNSYRSNTPYTLLMSDKGIVPGLKKALINAKKADRMFVVIPSSEAYGEKGSEGFVKPNEDLFYNILVMDVVKK
jgi:FKBP-type peptidyl-prolyl cis-trans isomerase